MVTITGSIEKDLDEYNPGIKPLVKRGRHKRVAVSPSLASSGDLLMFSYAGSRAMDRVVLVVGNRKGSGVFLSTKRNLLLSAFQLSADTEILRIIIKKLYKRKDIARYDKIIAGLSAILGRSNYRTFMLSKISNPIRLRADING